MNSVHLLAAMLQLDLRCCSIRKSPYTLQFLLTVMRAVAALTVMRAVAAPTVMRAVAALTVIISPRLSHLIHFLVTTSNHCE